MYASIVTYPIMFLYMLLSSLKICYTMCAVKGDVYVKAILSELLYT